MLRGLYMKRAMRGIRAPLSTGMRKHSPAARSDQHMFGKVNKSLQGGMGESGQFIRLRQLNCGVKGALTGCDVQRCR